MYQDNQLNAEDTQGRSTSQDGYTGPYRHKGYKRALAQLREALTSDNAVILKGVEGTGKSTLVTELISEHEHRGIPVALISEALPKASHFYAILADTLGVPKQKADLVKALRNTKEAGQFCLVVVDQDAINSSSEVEHALKQLCQESATTAGAVKLVVIRKDYLVIHTEETPEADFHNWINHEVTLDPLHTDDIEGYIYYLSATKGLQPTPYEIGTDFLMIEKTEGRIGRLKALLLPLIHKDVITRQDVQGTQKETRSIPSFNRNIMGAAILALLLIGVGINYSLVDNTPAPAITQKTEPTAVFAETRATEKETVVNPPSLGNKHAADNSQAIAQSSNQLSNQPQLEDLPQRMATASQAQKTTQAASPQTLAETTPLERAERQPSPELTSTATTAVSEAVFQNEVKQKLAIIEKELYEAVAENQRLKTALAAAQQTQAQRTQKTVENTAEATPLGLDISQAVLNTAAGDTAGATTELNSVESADLQTQPASELISSEEVNNTPVDKVETAAQPAVSLPEANTPQELPKSTLEAATEVVDTWQKAWQNQDHALYVSQYVTGFNGPYKTHQQWLKKRYAALNKPGWIKLSRSDFISSETSANTTKLEFWITYKADNGYKDKTHKRLTLKLIDGTWLISKEQNIKVEPFF